MYNRYIPAEDGTYRRQVMEERRHSHTSPPGQHPQPPKAQPPAPKPTVQKPVITQPPAQPPAPQEKSSLLGNLSSLFSGMDRSDLILLLLLVLLLTDGDSECDSTSLLLTIALYFLLQ